RHCRLPIRPGPRSHRAAASRQLMEHSSLGPEIGRGCYHRRDSPDRLDSRLVSPDCGRSRQEEGVVLAKDQTAIVGIGWTAYTRNSQASSMSLAAEASLKAIDDAGLTPRDIDGVMSWFHKYADSVSPTALGEAMSMDCPFALFVDSGGHWMCGAV